MLPFGSDRILAIPLSERRPPDKHCWDLDKKGLFSVRSAYSALFGDSILDSGPLSSRNIDKSVRNSIWHANILPRTKVFSGVRATTPCPRRLVCIFEFEAWRRTSPHL